MKRAFTFTFKPKLHILTMEQKFSDYYILREGDLLPERLSSTINKNNESFVREELAPFGLIFREKADAQLASDIVRAVLLALSSRLSSEPTNIPSHTQERAALLLRFAQRLAYQMPDFLVHRQTPNEESARGLSRLTSQGAH